MEFLKKTYPHVSPSFGNAFTLVSPYFGNAFALVLYPTCKAL